MTSEENKIQPETAELRAEIAALDAELTENFKAQFSVTPFLYIWTYALELAMLELTQAEVSNLRQEMLSCTVENREKGLLTICPQWEPFTETANQQKLLQTINTYLSTAR